mmetsp:Transcript_12019/g.31154  ORF Transcript_12019/g.31154 Transcript_12019/m.31154 type:complete len:402 (-) Transcript_12019:134-1339(-)
MALDWLEQVPPLVMFETVYRLGLASVVGALGSSRNASLKPVADLVEGVRESCREWLGVLSEKLRTTDLKEDREAIGICLDLHLLEVSLAFAESVAQKLVFLSGSDVEAIVDTFVRKLATKEFSLSSVIEHSPCRLLELRPENHERPPPSLVRLQLRRQVVQVASFSAQRWEKEEEEEERSQTKRHQLSNGKEDPGGGSGGGGGGGGGHPQYPRINMDAAEAAADPYPKIQFSDVAGDAPPPRIAVGTPVHRGDTPSPQAPQPQEKPQQSGDVSEEGIPSSKVAPATAPPQVDGGSASSSSDPKGKGKLGSAPSAGSDDHLDLPDTPSPLNLNLRLHSFHGPSEDASAGGEGSSGKGGKKGGSGGGHGGGGDEGSSGGMDDLAKRLDALKTGAQLPKPPKDL